MATEARTRKRTAIDGADGVAKAAAALNGSARRLDESPNDVLTTGAALSTGLAVGRYIGGAPRILITAAMLPALAMGWTLLGRSGRRTGTPTGG